MKRNIVMGCCVGLMALSLACSHNDQEKAREKLEQAKQKTRRMPNGHVKSCKR